MPVILELTNDSAMKVQIVWNGQVGYVNRNYESSFASLCSKKKVSSVFTGS